MVELFANLWDWLKDHAAGTSLFLAGVVVGLWLGALIAWIDKRRQRHEQDGAA
jgi:hypothetical protein